MALALSPSSSLIPLFFSLFFCPLTADNTWPSCLCSSVVSILARTLWGLQRFHERRHESCWDLKANHASSEKQGIDSLWGERFWWIQNQLWLIHFASQCTFSMLAFAFWIKVLDKLKMLTWWVSREKLKDHQCDYNSFNPRFHQVRVWSVSDPPRQQQFSRVQHRADWARQEVTHQYSIQTCG